MVVLAQNLQGYFQEALSTALQRSKSNLSEDVQAYLVYLLSDFARSERVYAGVNPGEEPILVLLLERARESPPAAYWRQYAVFVWLFWRKNPSCWGEQQLLYGYGRRCLL